MTDIQERQRKKPIVADPGNGRDERRLWRRRRSNGQGAQQTTAGVSVSVVVAVLAVLPVGFLLIRTFTDGDGFTLKGFQKVFTDPGAGDTLLNTLIYCALSTAIAMVIGLFLAFLAARTDAPFKRLIFVASMVPMLIPSVIYAPSWIFLAAPRIGLLNAPFEATLGVAPFDIFSILGMAWVQGLHMAPTAYLLCTAAFRASDPSIEEAALVSGVPRGRVFRKITIPMVRPALLSAGLIIFVVSIEGFEVPAVLGLPGDIFVLTSRLYLYLNVYPVDYNSAGAIAFTLMAVALVALWLSNRSSSGLARYGSISGKAFRPREIPLGKWRNLVGTALAVYFIVAVAAPLALLIWSSLLPYYQQPSLAVLASVNLDNYIDVFTSTLAQTSFVNSLIVGFASATIVMAISAVAAYVVVRSKAKGRFILDALAFSPLLIPGLVMGLAIAIVALRMPLPIYGTLLVLVWALVARLLPFGMRFANTAMVQISKDLEESASISGVSWARTFRAIILPLGGPALIAGWIYAFLATFRELSSTLVLYTPGQEVVPVYIFAEYNAGNLGVVSAIGVVLIVFLLGLAGLAYGVGRRFGVKVS